MSVYKVSIEVVNKELYQSVLSGRISHEEAHALKARILDKRKHHITRIALCAVLLLAAVTITLINRPAQFPEAVMYAWL